MDIIASGLPSGSIPAISRLYFGSDAARVAVVQYLVAYSNLLPALIVTVTSLAIATVTPFGNPSLFLLYRHEPSDLIPRTFGQFVSRRTNRFLLPFTLSLGLFLGLQTIFVSHGIGLTQVTAPSLVFLAAVAVALAFSSLTLVFTLIALRRSAAVVDYTYRIAINTVAAVAKSPSGWIAWLPWLRRPMLTRRHWPLQGVASPYTAHYEDQHILKMCVYTLTEAAIRSMEGKQRFQAREAVDALAGVSRRYAGAARQFPVDWGYLYRTTGDRPESVHQGCRYAKRQHLLRPLWLAELFVESFESVVLVSAEMHYQTVGQAASQGLVEVGEFLIGRLSQADTDADLTLDRVFEAYESALDECIQFDELVLFERLLRDLCDLLRKVPSDPNACPTTAAKLQERVRGAGWQAYLRESKAVFCERFTTSLVANPARPSWASTAISAAHQELLAATANARNMTNARAGKRRRAATVAVPTTSSPAPVVKP